MTEKPPLLPPLPPEESREDELKRLAREIEDLERRIADVEERRRRATDPQGKKALEREWGRLKNELAGRILRRDSLGK